MVDERLCPHCGNKKTWIMRRGKRRCASCRHEWNPNALPLRLTISQWEKIARYFVRGLRSEAIARKTRLHRQRVLRAVSVLQQIMVRDVPWELKDYIKDGIIYSGQVPAIKIKPKLNPARKPKICKASLPKPALRILWVRPPRGGSDYMWMQAAPQLKLSTLKTLFDKCVMGSVEDSIAGGEEENEPERVRRQQILSFKFETQGGIRSGAASRYQAENVWKYNYRYYDEKSQVKILIEQLREYSRKS